MKAQQLIVGVDGGGTKTTAWLALCDASGVTVVGRATVGGSNIQAVGADAAKANLLQAINGAFQSSGRLPERLECLCVGSAGSARADARAQLTQFLEERLDVAQLLLVSDAELLLAAAAEDGVGIALIAGTGSLAWGRNSSGMTARAGGWGFLLGDEGSAFAVGRAGVSAALRSVDSTGPMTLLAERICEHFRVDGPDALVSKVYGATDPRLEIASAAPVVFAAADAKDRIAVEIVHTAAQHLALLLTAAARQLQLPDSAALAMAGGLLVHQPAYRQLVCDLTAEQGWIPAQPQVITEPVAGAIQIAADQVRQKR